MILLPRKLTAMHSIRPSLFDVILVRRLIPGQEVNLCVLTQPSQELDHLFAETVDGLRVHVGLGDDLGQVD